MGIPTLIKTETASDDASLSFVDGTSDVVLDSTYDEYMFVFTDIGPATDNVSLQMFGSTDTGSTYGITKTTTFFQANHSEDDSGAALSYDAGWDLAQSATGQYLAYQLGNGADESASGIFHLFSPSSTVYVKHFYSRAMANYVYDAALDYFVAGYFNTTSAIDAIKFQMTSGNFDGVIQLYGIS